MLIKIDLQSQTPIYEQLYNEIVIGIATGQLTEGEALPSSRGLGAQLSINLHTVNKAYNLLKQNGYLNVARSRGVTVNPASYYPADASFKLRLLDSITPYINEGLARNMSSDDIMAIIETAITNINKEDSNG